MSKLLRFLKDFKDVALNKDKRNVILLRMRQQPMITLKQTFYYGVFVYTGMAIYYSYNYNEHFSHYFSFTRRISRLAGHISRIPIPESIRKIVYGQWVSTYNVIEDDMIKPLDQYPNFKEFFTREVKPRNIDIKNQNQLVSPADSKILQISEITGDKNILVKNIQYSLGEFLTGIPGYKMEGDVLNSMKKAEDKTKSKIYQVIFYLNPGDYHRYHSPIDMLVKRAWHIVGYLAPVKESYIGSTPGVYETNERVALVGEYHQGFISNVYVGATNVGSMTLTFDPELVCNQKIGMDFKKSYIREYSDEHQKQKQNQYQLQQPYKQEEKGILVPKGAECGMFQLGSTVVMLFEVQDEVKFLVEPGQKIRYGEPFAEIIKKSQIQQKVKK